MALPLTLLPSLTLLQPPWPPCCSCNLPHVLCLGALALCLWGLSPRSPNGLLFPSFRLCTVRPSWTPNLKLRCLQPLVLPPDGSIFEISDILQIVLFTGYPPLPPPPTRMPVLWENWCLFSGFNAVAPGLRVVLSTQLKAQKMLSEWKTMRAGGDGQRSGFKVSLSRIHKGTYHTRHTSRTRFPLTVVSCGRCLSRKKLGASLVAQWLGIRLPMHGTWVRALVREDPTCHNYWACALEPVSHNCWACMPQLLKPVHLEPVLCNKTSHHNEKPTHHTEE